jgi:D-beta-D-heptose 7-phosphate kinase/D-beta-D-heptose 1-phosphate adenosyltransferase
LSDYDKGVLDTAMLARLIGEARRLGRPVIVDPKKTDPRAFAGASVLKPNIEEMAQFTGLRPKSDDDAGAACRRLIELAGVDAVLLTRGDAGMTLVQASAPGALHVRAETHRVFDVTGAGDSVIATLAASLAAGAGLEDAVRMANAAAGVAVAKPGTATVLPGELREALALEFPSGAVSRDDAARQAAEWSGQGLKVGFTNGCFDLLHRGHLYSLRQAATRVDRLVVGINSDASTSALKGPGRPVQDEATRASVLAALRYVDLVVVFDEPTPEALIRAVKPNVVFKGADYAEEDVAGGGFVRSLGGRVELLPLLAGHSTTATVARMKPPPA